MLKLFLLLEIKTWDYFITTFHCDLSKELKAVMSAFPSGNSGSIVLALFHTKVYLSFSIIVSYFYLFSSLCISFKINHLIRHKNLTTSFPFFSWLKNHRGVSFASTSLIIDCSFSLQRYNCVLIFLLCLSFQINYLIRHKNIMTSFPFFYNSKIIGVIFFLKC